MNKKYLVVILVILLSIGLFFALKNKEKKTTYNISDSRPEQQNNTENNFVQPTTFAEDIATDENIFLEVTEPANNSIVSNSGISLRGKTVGDATVFMNEQEIKANANGEFSTTVNLDEGVNLIYIVAADEYGNYVEKEITVTLETAE